MKISIFHIWIFFCEVPVQVFCQLFYWVVSFILNFYVLKNGYTVYKPNKLQTYSLYIFPGIVYINIYIPQIFFFKYTVLHHS